MEYRKRFEEIINHREADRVPFDFNGTALTACMPEVTKKLADYFSISADNDAEAEEQIQKIFDIDFRKVGTLFFPDSEYADRSKSGQYTDSWGIVRSFQGMYWDITYSPFRDMELRDLKSYKWPSVKGISRKLMDDITEKAKRLYNDTDYVVVAEHPVLGYLELGCWIFGFDDFLYRLLAEPETTGWFFENYNKYVMDVNELYYGNIGKYIHVTTSGDDFGTQNSLFMSPEVFAGDIVPWYKKRITDLKQYTDAKYFHHSCGSVYRILDNIIEMGVDILNPIQPGAFEMEPERLKNEYGDKLTFWGGIDEQVLLTTGTPEQVINEVRRVNGILNKDGGWVMSASHNLQPDVPVENIVAMFNALR